MAYQLFENYEPKTFKFSKVVHKTAIEVCEGQQYDMDFEQRDNVQVDDYLKMIEYKTAVLVVIHRWELLFLVQMMKISTHTILENLG